MTKDKFEMKKLANEMLAMKKMRTRKTTTTTLAKSTKRYESRNIDGSKSNKPLEEALAKYCFPTDKNQMFSVDSPRR